MHLDMWHLYYFTVLRYILHYIFPHAVKVIV